MISIHTGLPVRSLPAPCILPRVNVQRTGYSQPSYRNRFLPRYAVITVDRASSCDFRSVNPLTCFHVDMSGLQEDVIRRACWHPGGSQLSLPTPSGAGCETLIYGPAQDRRRVFGAIMHVPRQPGTVTELSRIAHCPQ